MVWPFKWNLFSSTFTWYYLFLSILQNETWILSWILNLGTLGSFNPLKKGLRVYLIGCGPEKRRCYMRQLCLQHANTRPLRDKLRSNLHVAAHVTPHLHNLSRGKTALRIAGKEASPLLFPNVARYVAARNVFCKLVSLCYLHHCVARL